MDHYRLIRSYVLQTPSSQSTVSYMLGCDCISVWSCHSRWWQSCVSPQWMQTLRLGCVDVEPNAARHCFSIIYSLQVTFLLGSGSIDMTQSNLYWWMSLVIGWDGESLPGDYISQSGSKYTESCIGSFAPHCSFLSLLHIFCMSSEDL